jgi:hypothetical protein
MKKGDRLPVSIEGAVVGYAEVEHVGETEVTLFVPAQRVIAKKRTSLDLGAGPEASGTQHIVDGVEPRAASGDGVESPASGGVEPPVSPEVNEVTPVPQENVSQPPEPAVEPPAATAAEVAQPVEVSDGGTD